MILETGDLTFWDGMSQSQEEQLYLVWAPRASTYMEKTFRTSRQASKPTYSIFCCVRGGGRINNLVTERTHRVQELGEGGHKSIHDPINYAKLAKQRVLTIRRKTRASLGSDLDSTSIEDIS